MKTIQDWWKQTHLLLWNGCWWKRVYVEWLKLELRTLKSHAVLVQDGGHGTSCYDTQVVLT